MISIIICTLNEEHYLPLLLDSILNQEGILFEINIVDGGSHDGTLKIASEYQENSDVEISIYKSQKGVAIQRNYGAKKARYENLLFLDADVILPSDFLKQSWNEISENEILVAGTEIYAIEKSRKFRLMFWMYSKCYLRIVRLFHPVIHGCSIFSTKKLHEAIGGFKSDIIFEDYLYGSEAARIFRPPLLKSVYVRTSSRRLQKSSFSQSMELFFGAIYTFYKPGINIDKFQAYNKRTGNHIAPKNQKLSNVKE